MNAIRPAILLALLIPLLASTCSKKDSPTPQNVHPTTGASVWSGQNLYIDPPVGNIDDILGFYVQLNVATSKCLPIFLYDFQSDGTIAPIQQTVSSVFGPRSTHNPSGWG